MVGRLSLTRLDTPDIHNWEEGELLLLGLWCLEHPLETEDLPEWVSVVPYHWNDREKFRRDRDYLIDLCDRLEVAMADYLNTLHGTSRSVRYWRVIAGPWLWTFAAIVFDRWETVLPIREAVRSGSLQTSVPAEPLKTPRDYGHFEEVFTSDLGNRQLFDALLAYSPFEVPFGLGSGHEQGPIDTRASIAEGDPAPRGQRFSRPFARGTGLQAFGEALLVASLGRMPRRPRVHTVTAQANPVRPMFGSTFFTPRTPFEVFLAEIIASQIPVTYCEGFGELLSRSHELWRDIPSLICSGPGIYVDEVLKCGVAEATSRGARLVQVQHGGFYGVSEISFSEIHEVKISDLFLTWGWSQTGQPKVKPVGVTKRRLARRSDGKGSLLVSLGSSPRFSFAANSFLVSSQYCRYFRACAGLLDGLEDDVRRQTRLRLYPHDKGWNEEGFFRTRFPDLEFDKAGVSFRRSVRAARLAVATYNSTGFLETLFADIPTICFVESEALELRPSAEASFARLEEAGVLFRSAEAASNKINQVWGDVSGWWESPEVKEAVGSFVNLFARDPGNRVLAVRRAIRSSARS